MSYANVYYFGQETISCNNIIFNNQGDDSLTFIELQIIYI